MDMYTFDTLLKAQAMLDDVNNNSNFPIIGKNGRTRLLEKTKKKTERWASEIIECKDGKFRIPEPSDYLLCDLNILKETDEKDGILDIHKPVIEEYDKTKMPDPPEYTALIMERP